MSCFVYVHIRLADPHQPMLNNWPIHHPQHNIASHAWGVVVQLNSTPFTLRLLIPRLHYTIELNRTKPNRANTKLDHAGKAVRGGPSVVSFSVVSVYTARFKLN